jgi:hypothetical protein
MFHWLFNNEPKVIKYRCLLCYVCCNGHIQVQNHNDSKRHTDIMKHWVLVQSDDKMKFIIEEYDSFVHSFDGTSFISIYFKIVWMDVH